MYVVNQIIELAVGPWSAWIVLAAIACAGYALVEFIDEHLIIKTSHAGTGSDDTVGVLVLVSGLFGIVISIAILTFVVLLNATTVFVDLDFLRLSKAVSAGALETLWMIPYLYALKRVGAIGAGPLFQLVPVFSLVIGFLFFQEYPPIIHIIGCAIIVGGGVLLNYRIEKKNFDLVAILQMSLSSILISLGYFIFKDSALEGNFFESVFWGGIGMTIAAIAIWCLWKPYRVQLERFLDTSSPKMWSLQLCNECINAIALFATNKANILAPSVMISTAFHAPHPLFILFFGWVLATRGSHKHKSVFMKKEGLKSTIAILIIVTGAVVTAL
jgi:drug/metabolite transporter (DMT)-like permease